MENDESVRKKSLEVVRSYFELMHRKDVAGLGELWNEDATIYIPMPPKGFPSEYSGLRERILPGLEDFLSRVKSYDYAIIELHPSTDPEIVIVEWEVWATRYNDDKLYNGRSITVFKFQNEKISSYQDYFNATFFDIFLGSEKS